MSIWTTLKRLRSGPLHVIVVATLATLMLCTAAILVFDVEWRLLAQLLLACVAGVLVIALAAALVVGVVALIRRWLS